LLVAALAAMATLLIALCFSFAQRHKVLPAAFVRLVNLGYVIPGAVIAIGVMVAAGVVDRASAMPFTLIGGIGLLVYAFAVRFLAVAGQPLQGALRQQPVAMDDAARMLGASPARTFLRVNLPLLRPALLAAAMLVAMDVVKELPLTLILRPFDFDTLSTSAFELARIEQLREASLPALAIVLCGTLPVLLLDRWAAQRER
jgi:iron(III) transport system permease protein